MSTHVSLLYKFLRHTQSQSENGCILWNGATTHKGYGYIQQKKADIYPLATTRSITAHRLSYILFIGPIPVGLCVCHKCNVRLCVNPDHLFLGTNIDNTSDMVKKLRHAYGERHRSAKLTEEQVIQIRSSYASGETSHRKLAKIYGVKYQTIQAITKKKSWARI